MEERDPSGVVLLTPASLPAYLAERAATVGQFGQAARLAAEPITGGNLNFAWKVEEVGTGKCVFVKQAPCFVAFLGKGGMPLTESRMALEVAVFREWEALLGPAAAARFLPKLFFFDDINMVFVMEYLGACTLMDREMMATGLIEPAVACGLGDFLGEIHAATHSALVHATRAEALASTFENAPMRNLQLEFVFSKAYEKPHASLRADPEFKREIEQLKAAYKSTSTEARALCHGDLHPGSVMIGASGTVKIIDPEFVIYGPPGLDVGSLFSGFVLSAVHHTFAQTADSEAVVRSLRSSASLLWDTYAGRLLARGLGEGEIAAIGIDAVGFAVAEVARTALGFAGGREWLSFPDPSVMAQAVAAALAIVNRCMTGRHEAGVAALWAELEALPALVSSQS